MADVTALGEMWAGSRRAGPLGPIPTLSSQGVGAGLEAWNLVLGASSEAGGTLGKLSPPWAPCFCSQAGLPLGPRGLPLLLWTSGVLGFMPGHRKHRLPPFLG